MKKCDWCYSSKYWCRKHNTCASELCKNCSCCEPYVERSGPLKFWKDNERKHNKSKRFLGVEIEVAGHRKTKLLSFYRKLHRVINRWHGEVVSDEEFEINTAPANGDAFIKQINQITRLLKKQRTYVDGGCGLHVHVDARDFKDIDFRKLAIIYSSLEDFIFKLVPPDRRRSDWCRPVKDNLTAILSEYNGNLKREFRLTLNGKDVALNFAHTYPHGYGTVECRLFNGSVDKRDITNWGMFLAQMFDYVKGHELPTIEKLSKKNTKNIINTITTPKVRNWIKERYKKINRREPLELR